MIIIIYRHAWLLSYVMTQFIPYVLCKIICPVWFFHIFLTHGFPCSLTYNIWRNWISLHRLGWEIINLFYVQHKPNNILTNKMRPHNICITGKPGRTKRETHHLHSNISLNQVDNVFKLSTQCYSQCTILSHSTYLLSMRQLYHICNSFLCALILPFQCIYWNHHVLFY